MKIHRAVLAASLLLCAAPFAASATTLHTAEIGYSNVGISIGGLHTSLPAGFVAIGSKIGDGFLVGARLTAGAGNGLNYYNAQALIGHPDALEPGLAVMPFVSAGYTRINGGTTDIGAATAGVGGAIYWRPFHDLQLSAKADFGRDFGTHFGAIPTSGGLYYGLGANASTPVGPGSLTVGYSYKRLPMSANGGLNLRESTFSAGYTIPF